jgi:hypothetical protein
MTILMDNSNKIKIGFEFWKLWNTIREIKDLNTDIWCLLVRLIGKMSIFLNWYINLMQFPPKSLKKYTISL